MEFVMKSAEYAVDKFIEKTAKPFIIGIGSGSTVIYAVEFIAKRYREENLNIICVPSSFQAKQLIVSHKLPLGDLELFPNLDLALDGADEVDKNQTLIKGGGACLTMEKIVAFNSKKFIVIADESKCSDFLGQKWKTGIPVEVIPVSYVSVIRHLKMLNYEAVLRYGINKAGPIVTDNGCFILDLMFDAKKERNWAEENQKIKMIPGVVETGLFVNMADYVIFGKNDSTSRIVSNFENKTTVAQL
uniref:ribose-5-phosphate isomerase n=1 Tax=Myxobolus squamalis TaxID=59785 RepID=A0A6B2FWX8_MYXSQ